MLRHVKSRRDGTVSRTTIQVDNIDPVVVAARMTVAGRIAELSVKELGDLAGLFDRWQPGLHVTEGTVIRHDARLYQTVQTHTTQADWPPPDVPALFVLMTEPDSDGVIPWGPGIAVEVGDVVSYLDVTYETIQAHTTQTGWEPPAVPSLFEEINDG